MKTLLRTTLVLAGFVLAGFNSPAATRTWTGGAILNDLWSDKDNWANDNDPVSGDILVFPAGIQFSDKGMVNTFGSGTVFQRLTFNEYGYTVSGSSVRLSGGMVIDYPTGSVAAVTFNVPVRLTASQAFQSSINGSLDLRPGVTGPALDMGSHTLTCAGNGHFLIEGEVTGSGGFTADGPFVTFQRANSYTGLTVISGGVLMLWDNNLAVPTPTLGTVDSPTDIHTALWLAFERDTVVSEQLNIFDSGYVAAVTPPGSSSGIVTLAGNIVLHGPGNMSLAADLAGPEVLFHVDGRISGNGDLFKSPRSFAGPSDQENLTIGGTQANTFTGSYHVQSGTTLLAKPTSVTALSCQSVFVDPIEGVSSVLRLNASHQIVDTAQVTVQERGTFDLQSRIETIRALTLAGGTVAGTVSSRLDVTENINSLAAAVSGTVNAELHIHASPCLINVEDGAVLDDLVFNGIVVDESGASIKKTGPGRVVFNELGTMPVEIAEGTAIIHSAPGSHVSLNGGTFAGTGTIGILSSLAGGGRVAPGSSTGIMTNTTIAWNSATTYEVEILNATPGSGHDQIKVFLGSVTLGGAHLEVSTLPGFGTTLGEEIVIIENNGSVAVTNTFAGLPDGAEFTTASGARFTVHYHGGDGNDVTLRTTSVPPTGVSRLWSGVAAGSLWTAAGNWNPTVVPNPGDNLIFSTSSDKTITNDLPVPTPFNGLTISSSGYTIRGNAFAVSGPLTATFTGPPLRFETGLQLTTNVTFTANSNTAVQFHNDGGASMEFYGHTLTLNTASASSEFDFLPPDSGPPVIHGLSGTGTLIKQGPGVVVLSTPSASYAGSVTVAQGTLSIRTNNALGDPGTGSTTLSNSAVLELTGATPVLLQEQVAFHAGSTVRSSGAAHTLLGDATLGAGEQTIEVPDGSLNFFAAVSGVGGLRKTGVGDVLLTGTTANTATGLLRVQAGTLSFGKGDGTNAWAGPVEVTGGTLRLSNDNQIPNDVSVTVRGPGSLDLNGRNESLGGLFLQGGAVQTGAGVLTLDGDLSTIATSNSAAIVGQLFAVGARQWTITDGTAVDDLVVNATVAGTSLSSVRKSGGGRVTFSANNTLPVVQLDAGTALFNGSNFTRIDLNGGTLGGTGSIANLTSLAGGGTVAHGASTGILTSSNVSWNAATTFSPELRNATPGTGHDQLKVKGAVTLGGAALDVTVLSNFTATVSDTFVLLDNDGTDAITGTFTGLSEGATFTKAELGTGTPRTFRISYVGGTNSNDVTLKLVVLGTGITRTWDGGGTNNNWSVNTNWDANVTAPAPGDALVFPAGAARLLNTNNFTTGTSFDSITIRASGYTLRGNRVALIQGLVFDNPGSSSTVNMPLTLSQSQSFTAVNDAFGIVAPQGAGATLDNAGFTLTVHTDTEFSRVDVSGLTGSGALVKTGRGGSLLALNTHSGLTTISEGSVLLTGTGDGFGTAAAGTIVNSGASVQFNGVTSPTLAEPFTLAGALHFSISPIALIGPITLPNGAQATIDVSLGTPSLRGVISGSGALRKTGANELILDGTAANTFTGGAIIEAGGPILGASVLRLQKTAGITALRGPVLIDGTLGPAELRLINANQILDSASLTLKGAGALFNLNNRDETVNDLTFTGGAVQTGTGILTLAGDLTALAATNSASLDGTVAVANLAVWDIEDGPLANDFVANAGIIATREESVLVKAGAGRAVFAGNNTLPFLRIDEGDAAITRDSSAVIALLNSGTLSGDGIIGGISNLVAGGVLAPGNGLGRLSCTGAVILIEKTVFTVELLNPTPGSGYDTLAVQGAVDLGFAELSVTLLPGFTPAQGQQFTIIDNQGAGQVLNEFAGLAEGKELDLGTVRFRISYKGGDGNDVVLTTSLVVGTGIASRWDGGAGAGDAKWTTAANWEGDLAPVQGNAIVFPSGPAQRNAQNDFPAGTTFASILFEGGSYTLTGNRVVLNDGVLVAVPPNDPGIVLSLPLKLAQNQTFNVATNGLILAGGLDTDGQTLTLQIGAPAECTVNTLPISGTGSLTKTGPGNLVLSVNNTYSGATLLQGGRAIVTTAGALGGAGGTTIQAAELELRDTAPMTISEPITLTSTNSVLRTTNSHTLTGAITLSGAGAREFRVGNLATLTMNGRISGPGTLRKTDVGGLRLGGSLANTFTGGAAVEGGSLSLTKTTSNAIPGALTLGTAGAQTFSFLLSSNQIADSAVVTVKANSQLSCGAFQEIIGGLVLQNGIVSTDPAGLLTVNGNVQCLANPNPAALSLVSTISGRVQVTGGARTWNVANGSVPEELLIDATVSTGVGASLLKTGSGTLHFLKPTTISQIQIDAGSALFDLANPGTLIQLNGGLLGGAGSVSHVTSLAGGGTIAPGLGLGPLTSSNLAWNAATTYRYDINAAASDRLNALGPVNLGNAALVLAMANAPAINDSFPLILNESGQPITGTFDGLPEGALFAASGVIFQISYVGADADDTDGNDVQITRVPAPPSLLSGMATLPNGFAQFTITGVPGADYLVEASTDLIVWQSLGSVTAGANGIVEFIDQESITFPHRFYRVVSP